MSGTKNKDVGHARGDLKELALRAKTLAQNAHLVAINMQELHVVLHAEPSDTKQVANLALGHETGFKFTPKTDSTPNKLRVEVRFDVGVHGAEEALFTMKVVINADYFLPATMPEEAKADFGAFSETNAMIHVWPYFRELVQSTTWRMGLPPFPMPLFRITDGNPKKERHHRAHPSG